MVIKNTSYILFMSSLFGGMTVATPALADASISSSAAGGAIILTASGGRFAGAISSLTYRGVQYIDIADHGRQMQSAIQVDGWGECYNPNEAGSVNDGTSQTSTSVLLSISSASNILQTRTQPAYWYAHGQAYGKACNPSLPAPKNSVSVAQNPTDVSDFVLSRTSAFYGFGIPNLLNVDTSWTVPRQFETSNTEASTAYLPTNFNVFLTFDRASRTLTKVQASATDSAATHTSLPVIISQANGQHSMGAFSPLMMTNPGRGYMAYFNFTSGAHPSSKWSCVYGETNIQPGSTYSYSCPIAVGTVDEVLSAIEAYPVPGQSVSSMIPVYRFYKSSKHFMTLSYTEAAKSGYLFETTGFHTFPVGGTGYQPLYRCYNPGGSGDHFISTQANCEGNTAEGVIGYASSSQIAGSVPLYRFYKINTADHLITVNYSEGSQNGYALEGILGYVKY